MKFHFGCLDHKHSIDTRVLNSNQVQRRNVKGNLNQFRIVEGAQMLFGGAIFILLFVTMYLALPNSGMPQNSRAV